MPPLIWKPSAIQDMRALARYAPREMLSGALKPDAAGTPGPLLPLEQLYDSVRARWAMRARVILAHLHSGEMYRDCGARIRDDRCEACSLDAAPWNPPALPSTPGSRRERRKHMPPTPVEHTRVMGLGDILRFGYAYHADVPLEHAVLCRHVAWHFAPAWIRQGWRKLQSREQRESELSSIGGVMLDAAVHAYEALDATQTAAELRESLMTVLTDRKLSSTNR
jgi:hypothetical protein